MHINSIIIIIELDVLRRNLIKTGIEWFIHK